MAAFVSMPSNTAMQCDSAKQADTFFNKVGGKSHTVYGWKDATILIYAFKLQGDIWVPQSDAIGR